MAKVFWIAILMIIGSHHIVLGQSDSLRLKKTGFYDYRGSNAIGAGVGTSVINGDLPDPMFEIYFNVGYKRYILPYLDISVSYHKFNLAFKDVYNQGFMSFDLNIGSTLMPNNRFSPFIFAGAGYNAANYFEQKSLKLQSGGGVEYIVAEGIGIKLYADYNHVLSDELDGLIAGASDDTYFRVGVGLNYYFGGGTHKDKIKEGQPTIFNSNEIISHN